MNPPQDVAPPSAANDRVERDYRSRLVELNGRLAREQRRRSVALTLLIGSLAALVLASVGRGRIRFTGIAVIPALGIVLSLREYVNRRRALAKIVVRCGFYERGLERLRLDWQALERTGEEFARSDHLYQFDLQILGQRSLFSLLCTTRSEAGAACLAAYLLDPADLKEARARQEAIQELRGLAGLREQIALLGKYRFQGCDADTLREWLRTPVFQVPPAVPIALFISGSAVLLAAVASLTQIVAWTQVLPFVLSLLLVQTIMGTMLFRRIRRRLRVLRVVARECSVLQEGLRLLEQQDFRSSKLKDLVDRSRSSSASLHLRRLERLFWGIAQREKEFLSLVSLMTSAGTQLVLAVERWRAQFQGELSRWVDLWAEFDALNAIACYAYENPDHIFPELVDGEATLALQGLGHPLLPFDRCIRSDVDLSDSPRFWILSGSNMAGKSTLLRAVGMNAVLAYAGAPIRAAHAQLSQFRVCASIALSDSLLDGKSKFLAEAERLMLILRQAGTETPVLFLIDEILSGTNSEDRRLACGPVVRALLSGGAVGILSTHDLALTAIADERGLNGLNCCMESDDPNDPLHFDYRVKPGISRRSSATAILRLMGLSAESQ